MRRTSYPVPDPPALAEWEDGIRLDLPARQAKPRQTGLTMVIDPGVPTRLFEDLIESQGELIDFIKFGWGTALVTPDLGRKVACLHRHRVDFFFGGTLFEKFLLQGRFDGFRALCRRHGVRHVEVSNGTIPLSNTEKARWISALAGEFEVLSEVGFKDPCRSAELEPAEWARCIREDLDAGSRLVITESRESGKSGICTPDGKPREDVVTALLSSSLDPARIVFEAPTKDLQTYFIRRIGPVVNLGNVAVADVIPLETLRLGLRADTLLEGMAFA
jgi:phosphosulfolactate synthase